MVCTLFFTKSTQRHKQTSEKHEACFDIFHSECSVCPQSSAKLTKGLLSRTQKQGKYQENLHFCLDTLTYPIYEAQTLVILA